MKKYYGFTHQYPELLEQAAYGLAEWCGNKLKEANLIAVPGCYPTAAQLALKPLIDADLLDLNQWPVINATSGVSGAGRKAAISNSFCEVSLQPYGVFTHRHQPEIATHLGADVIFTPHLGNFPRGILETITCRLKSGVTQAQVAQVLQQAYAHKPLVRLYDKGVPALKKCRWAAILRYRVCRSGRASDYCGDRRQLTERRGGTSGTVRQYSFRLCGNAVSYLRVQ